MLIRNTPFDSDDIRKEYFKSNVDGASCCGAKEYLRGENHSIMTMTPGNGGGDGNVVGKW